MNLRSLGKTGLRVSALGLGTVKFGRAVGVKYPTPVRLPSDSEALELLTMARGCGINLIDTAPAYGNAEERLGGLLGDQRDSWILCTKAGEEFENGQSRFDFSPGAIRASVERSLARLKTDRLEIVLVHSDGRVEQDLVTPGIVDVLDALKREGKLRAFGASTKTLAGALHAIDHCDVVMVTLNPSHQTDAPAIACAHARGVGVLVKKVFDSGHLTGGDRVTGQRTCLKLALNTPGVSSIIVGTTSPDHLRENAAITEE